MDVLFFLLFSVCLIALIIGLVKPRSVIRWGNEEKKNRKNVLKYYGLGVILFFILFGANAGTSGTAKETASKSASISTTVEDQTIKDKKAASDLDAKIAALGDVNSLTLDKSAEIGAVRTSYEALTSDQKSLVSKLSTLTEAEGKVSELKAAAAKAVVATSSSSSTSAVNSAPSQSQNNEYTVYITKTGKKYHRAGCRSLSKSQISISKSDAISEGYTPCSVCNP